MSDDKNLINEALKRIDEMEADLPPLREIPEGVRLSDVDAYMYRHWPVRIVGGFVGDEAVIAPHGMPQEEFDRLRANFLRRTEDQRRADEDAQRAIEAERKAEADKNRGKRKASGRANEAEAHAQKLMAAGATQGSAWIESEAKYKLQPGTLKKRKQRNKK